MATTNDKLIQLELELKSIGVPRDYYSIGKSKNECTCILRESEKWLVFYSERGRREDLHNFTNFEDARSFMVNQLKDL